MLKTYLLNFSIGTLGCQLMTITPEYEKAAVDKYYRHRHPFFEVHYIFSGTCEIGINDARYELGAGQLILIAPNVYHSVENASDQLQKACIGLYLDSPPSEDGLERSLYTMLHSSPVCVLSDPNVNGDIAHIFEKLRAIAAQSAELDAVLAEELKAYSGLLLLHIFRTLQPSYAPKSNTMGQSISERRYIIDEFFNRQYGLHNGSRQLADALFVSERQMDRILLEYYGKNYRDKLKETRGQIGYNLITSSQLSFSDIAYILGYTNPANFSTFIKKTYGCSPSQLRQAAQPCAQEE